jgi:hypothetical protein
MGTIFPILENLQLQRKEVFNIPLYQSDKAIKDMPIIAFAEVNESNRNTIIENTEDVSLSGGELVREAFKNLKAFDIQWREKNLNHSQHILCAEAEWAAEKILDQAFLIQAIHLLQSKQILVAIPKRGVIMAAPLTYSELDTSFCNHAYRYFDDMGGIPLFEKLFIVENGQIIGLSNLKPVIEKQDDEVVGTIEVLVKKEIASKVTKMVYINGFESYSVSLGAHDYDDFTNAAYQIIVDILTMNRHNPNFNGLIEFSVLSEWLPKNREFDNILVLFFDRLKMQPQMAKFANAMRKDIDITFIHLSDLQTGNSHLKYRLKIHSTI